MAEQEPLIKIKQALEKEIGEISFDTSGNLGAIANFEEILYKYNPKISIAVYEHYEDEFQAVFGGTKHYRGASFGDNGKLSASSNKNIRDKFINAYESISSSKNRKDVLKFLLDDIYYIFREPILKETITPSTNLFRKAIITCPISSPVSLELVMTPENIPLSLLEGDKREYVKNCLEKNIEPYSHLFYYYNVQEGIFKKYTGNQEFFEDFDSSKFKIGKDPYKIIVDADNNTSFYLKKNYPGEMPWGHQVFLDRKYPLSLDANFNKFLDEILEGRKIHAGIIEFLYPYPESQILTFYKRNRTEQILNDKNKLNSVSYLLVEPEEKLEIGIMSDFKSNQKEIMNWINEIKKG